MSKLKLLQTSIRARDLRSVKLPPKVAEPFYSSKEWIALRDQVRREARGICQAPGCERRGYIVDHIVEISDGGARLDRTNLMLTCSPCHGRKTAAERTKRSGLR